MVRPRRSDVDARLLHSYSGVMRLRRRPSGDATVFELLGWLVVLSVFWPLGVYLLIRHRVAHSIAAGYRSGSAGV
jgi:hypothetical protein